MRTGVLLHRFALFLALGVLWAAIPGAVAGALAQEARNPDGIAVIIGNRDYTHRDVPEVTFAHRDADAFRGFVIDVLGYNPENIIDLRDATRGELFDAFGTRTDPRSHLWSYLNPEGGSDVVVFYSGHGVPGLNDGRGYLLPSDANPKDAEHDGYPIDLLYKNVGGLAEAETVQVYLDACFSGSSAGGAVIKDASPVYLTPKLPEGVGDKVVSLTAASGEQVASWDREVEHGLFTYHLLDALSGGGDADEDGQVTASEAKAYLDKYMTRAARRQHRRVQEASLLGSEGVVLAAAWVGGASASRGDPDDSASLPIVEEPGGEANPFAAALELDAVTGGNAFLVVETAPPGASVLVSGAKVGETPFSAYDLRAGTYTVTLDHPTHETVVLEGQVLADHQVLRIEQTLNPATGKVTVLTRPEGAWVEHEGARLAENTPVTLAGLPSGPLVLTLGAAGHGPVRVEVNVPKRDVTVVQQVLEAIQYGTLTLELEPTDAQALLPDSDTPYRVGMRLAEGEHEVRVTREGYREVSRVVTVAGDTRQRIVLARAPQPFTVVTTPADAVVQLLGVSEVYRAGMTLLPGAYRVRVSAEGWETQEASVRHGTAPTRHAVTLKRTWNPAAEEAALGLERSEKKLVQLGLAAAGFSPGGIDGLIGGDTRKALRAWQSKQGHEATGHLTADQAKVLLAAAREAQTREREAKEAARKQAAEEAEGKRAAEEAARMQAAMRPGRTFREENCKRYRSPILPTNLISRLTLGLGKEPWRRHRDEGFGFAAWPRVRRSLGRSASA